MMLGSHGLPCRRGPAGAPAKPSRRFQQCLARSTSAPFGAAAGSSARPVDARQAQKRAEQLNELLQETVQLALQTGPKGIVRSLQAADAVLSLAREQLQAGRIDPPEAILRKLFEKLGATYIKLGQFIASSPSVFPDEYVTEFQKCLDKAEPVPFEQIKKTIREELKQPIEEVFLYIDPNPLATASIAQVRRAVPAVVWM
jgi:aarF domain-containing kinase